MRRRQHRGRREKALTALVTGTTCNRYPAIPTAALSDLATLRGFQMGVTTSEVDSVSRADSTQGVGVLPTSH